MKTLINIVIVSCFLTGCVHTKVQTGDMYTVVCAFDKAKAIKYVPEIMDRDYWQTPKETIKFGQGDCEDKSIYLQRLLLDGGIKSSIVFGELNKGDRELHVWNEAYIYGELYVLDATSNIFGKKSEINKKYPNSYACPYLSIFDEEIFILNVRFLKRRLKEGNEKTDLIACISM